MLVGIQSNNHSYLWSSFMVPETQLRTLHISASPFPSPNPHFSVETVSAYEVTYAKTHGSKTRLDLNRGV